MRWLRRADLGSEEIAYRTAQNLYSLHRSVRVTDVSSRWTKVPYTDRVDGVMSCAKQSELHHQSRLREGGVLYGYP